MPFLLASLAATADREVVVCVESKLDDELWRTSPWTNITTVVNIKGDTGELVATAHAHGAKVLWNTGPKYIEEFAPGFNFNRDLTNASMRAPAARL